MSAATFSERFCAEHGLLPEEYMKDVLRRSLYPMARVLQPLLGLKSGYFASDCEFISCVGGISRESDFELEVYAYIQDPMNCGFLRRNLRLRVSATRLHILVRRTLRGASAQPSQPLGEGFEPSRT